MSKPKNNFKRIISSKLFLFLMSLALIVLGVNLIQETYKKYHLSKEIEQLRAEAERLETGNDQLAELMEYLKQEAYLEKEARIKLNLKRPGEKVVIVPEGAPLPEELKEEGPPEPALVFQTEPKANYWKWWEYFFSP